MSEETRQWGTDHDPKGDVGRANLRRRDLAESLESLTITLQPVFPQPEGAVPSGSLRIAWGLAEYSADWRMLWP